MCGIAGYYNFKHRPEKDLSCLERMIASLQHRGPDGYGFFQDKRAGLAHARLAIIDLDGGWQPIHNEDKSCWIIFNGEIFNYPELRQQLLRRGHTFSTQSDTEVIIHLYEEKGEACLQELNGQFAIAIYDCNRQELFLARDRMGIRPLFYTVHNGQVLFGSEIKALFSASNDVPRAIDPAVLVEIFTFWSPGGNETVFKDVQQIAPGCLLKIDQSGRMTQKRYWEIPFGSATWSTDSEQDLAEQLRELLLDATRLRLRADVPVGAYLSGGLDSSSITSLIKNFTENRLKSFSVTFSDQVYDEQSQQNIMVEYLGTDHHSIHCTYNDIGKVFPDVVYHTESPVVRTAPAPLYMLSSLVRNKNYKVVLTGEGADEILGGYDIFKEAKVRAFIAGNSASSCRSYLLKRLYPYLALSPSRSAEYACRFFDTGAPLDDVFYGHRPRWKTASGMHQFLTDEITSAVQNKTVEKLQADWQNTLQGLDVLSRTQFLESRLLLGNYLLCSQGDRMSMAHSVEGRYPFLDHRVVEFACTVPPRLRMKALNEKNILKKAMADYLPHSIAQRKKQPYMAPDILSFFGDKEPDYVDFFLSEKLLGEAGLFKEKAVNRLLTKCRKKKRQGFRENMAFVGMLSTMIVYHKFIKEFAVNQVPFCEKKVNVCRR